MNASSPLIDALRALGELSFLGWLLLLIGLLIVNRRAGLPRAARDLKLRGLGFFLFVLAAVLGLGRGLAEAWPWPPQAALLCAALAPLAARALFRRGRLGWALLAGLSFPFFLLITLTALFGLWLDLGLIGGGLLALALALSLGGALLTWRTPRPAQSPFAGFSGGGFSFGPGGFRRTGRGGAASNDDIVDVEARAVDEPAPPALPRRDD